ncbi:MAG: YtxH domain-containing protein [Candidatus Acidiferrales bacterium]
MSEGGFMTNQAERLIEENQATCKSSTIGYLAAGLGIGAALSVFFAPRSGEETRKWMADKCLNAVDAANQRVRESRTHVKEAMDHGQQKISEAVAAGREAIHAPKAAATQPQTPAS